jgi:hypothetical protein
MNIILIGAISTGVVIVLSIISTMPAFLRSSESSESRYTSVMLSFSITKEGESKWCQELTTTLGGYDELKATVFVSGKSAELNPECLSELAANSNIDIGSMTYSYQAITSFDDYLEALREVELGKSAVDRVANVNSKTFKAPHGLTDENIYSYLSRNGITADFSYDDHYNYYQGQFIRYDASVVQGSSFRPELITTSGVTAPIIIEFNDSMSIRDIERNIQQIVNLIKTDQAIRLVNASDLTGAQLTSRGS